MPHVVSLSALDYSRLYGSESGWEFWFGEPRRKPMPTPFHGILQLLLGQLLKLAGYRASTETELRIAPDWFPRPDVTGIDKATPVESYPTRPVDVVFEVLSEGEEATEKCRLYSNVRIPQIFYFDPEQRKIYAWDSGQLVPVENVALANGATIMGEEIWTEFERAVKAC